jgi:Tol biopolymer transport system component
MRSIVVLALALTTAVSAAAAEPQGSAITFMNSGGLFGVRPDDNSLSLLRGTTCTAGTAALPCPIVRAMSWSPDGTRLAFTYGAELYLFDSRDGTQRVLPTGVEVDGASRPAWSPDGNEVAFASVITEEVVNEPGPGGKYSSGATSSLSDLYSIHVDLGTVRKLTTGKQTTDPAWAPGRQIVYSSLAQDRWELNIIDPGGGHRALTDGGAGVNRRAAWSPDGTEIAFLRDAGGLQARLNTIRPDGSGLRQLSNLPIDLVQGDQPAWSPDGSTIAVSTSLNGYLDIVTGNKPGRDLYVVSSDGSGERRLTQSAERGVADRGPTWSPDGDQLAFESFDRDKASESALYTANADGRCETRVSAVGGWRPAWQPIRGSALAPRECTDLAVLAIGPTRLGPAGRFRVRLLNDGTKPLTGMRLRSGASAATVISAAARDAACSVTLRGLDCRINQLGVGQSLEVDVLVEARVLTRVKRKFVGPRIAFFATARTAETSSANNSLDVEVSTTSCGTRAPGAGLIRGTGSDNDLCGRTGRDRILGLNGADRIWGGAGNDVLNGGPGNDIIDTGLGNDVVSCGAGFDKVKVLGADKVAKDCERII